MDYDEESPRSVIDNYEVLLGVWEEAQRGHLDGEMKAPIVGVETLMHSFDFLFGVFLGELILRHSDNLSKTLQHKTLSAAEGQQIARLTVEVSSRCEILKGSLHSIAVLCKSRSVLVSLILVFRGSVVFLNALKIAPQQVIFIQQQKIITDKFSSKQ